MSAQVLRIVAEPERQGVVLRLPVGDDALLGRFLEHLDRERLLSPATVTAYRSDIEHLRAFLAEQGESVVTATYPLLRAFVGDQQTRGYSRSTLRRRAASTRTFYAWLLRSRIVAKDPAALLLTPKAHHRLPRVPTVAEVHAIIAAVVEERPTWLAFHGSQGTCVPNCPWWETCHDGCGARTSICQGSEAARNRVRGAHYVFVPFHRYSPAPALRDRAILELLWATGMRVAELTGLSEDRLSLKRQEAIVLGKGSKERVVFLGEPAVDAMRAWLKAKGDGPLWPNHRGKAMSTRDVRRVVGAYSHRVMGRGLSPHAFRHAFAVAILEAGMLQRAGKNAAAAPFAAGLRDVQELLGHASLTTTERYTQLAAGVVRRVYQEAHPRA